MRQPSQHVELFDVHSMSENVDVEFKSGRGGLPKSLWETYSAFANSNGGVIVLGVEQIGDEFRATGVRDSDKLVRDFWNSINNRDRVSCNVLRNDDVVISSRESGLVFIKVPRADRRQRPVYVGRDPFKGTYRRYHEGDYLCSEDEVRRMFADSSVETADSRVLPEFSFGDLDQDSIAQFRNRFRSRDPNHPWLREDDRGLLARLGGWRLDRRTGEEGITVAGLLMFGRTEAIQAPEGVPGFYLDYRERFSEHPSERWTDRVTIDGTWEANLFQFYEKVILKLGTGPGIRQPYQVGDDGYRRKATPVTEALQEALVNALIHADHFGQGGIVIDRYLDGIEFSNPGTLLISREQLLRGGISECRNKALQLMFQMLGVGDRAGSGLDKIRTSWLAENWQSPRLWETVRPDRVYLELPMVSLLPEETVARLRSRHGEEFDQLNSDEVQALVAAEVEGEITNQRLQTMLSLHRVDITRMLQGLVQRGFLVPVGIGRGTRYHPAGEDSEPPEAGSPGFLGSGKLGQAHSLERGSSPQTLGRSSPQTLGNSPQTLGETSGSVDERGRMEEPDVEKARAWGELLRITEPIRNSAWAPKDRVRAAIVEACSVRPLSLGELAELLGREKTKLRERHIVELVREGRLLMTLPQEPNHPRQAYRAANPGNAEDETG